MCWQYGATGRLYTGAGTGVDDVALQATEVGRSIGAARSLSGWPSGALSYWDCDKVVCLRFAKLSIQVALCEEMLQRYIREVTGNCRLEIDDDESAFQERLFGEVMGLVCPAPTPAAAVSVPSDSRRDSHLFASVPGALALPIRRAS